MLRKILSVVSCVVLSLFASVAVVNDADAHTIRPVVVTLLIEDSQQVDIQIRANAEVILAEIPPEYADTNDAPNAAQYDALRAISDAELAAAFDAFGGEYADRLMLLADGERVDLTYDAIEVESQPDPELARQSNIYLKATLPDDAAAIVWDWPEQYGSNVLRIKRVGEDDTYSTWLKQGQISDSFPLGEALAERSTLVVAWDYIVIGFEHIIPKGLDHILFVFGIFLLSTRLGPLLWQVTAFTLAHTITLGLSIYGFISAPASIVEPLIALSIAYVGIENCIARGLKPWRVVLVFCFGLLHGMGFAGVLSEIGLPRSEFLTALIAFNVGVEFGQLAVILLAFIALGWWREQLWYRARIVIPFSLTISAIGLYWTVERVLG